MPDSNLVNITISSDDKTIKTFSELCKSENATIEKVLNLCMRQAIKDKALPIN